MQEYFHTPDNYFMSHSVGCLPRRTQTDLNTEFFKSWEDGQNWTKWMPVLDKFRTGVANILGAEQSEICPQINISSALTKILYSLPEPTTKNIILLSEEDFPTIGFVFEQAKKRGYLLRFVDGNPSDIDNWEKALDHNVAIVHATHALSNTSHLLPVKEICQRAKEYEAISIIDIAQSAGVVPIDVKAWGCDFAIGTGVKFLCFGPGACFLYVASSQMTKTQPLDVGWFSHENPFEMDIHNFKYAKDAMRFFGGTPSPAPFVMANSAMAVWGEIGLEAVHSLIQKNLTAITDAVPPRFLTSPLEPAQRGGTVVITPEQREALRESFAQHAIQHDERKEGFRCSVHGYTSEDDIATLKQALNSAF